MKCISVDTGMMVAKYVANTNATVKQFRYFKPSPRHVINYCDENLFIISMYDVNSILSLIIQKQISFIVKFIKLKC